MRAPVRFAMGERDEVGHPAEVAAEASTWP